MRENHFKHVLEEYSIQSMLIKAHGSGLKVSGNILLTVKEMHGDLPKWKGKIQFLCGERDLLTIYDIICAEQPHI